MKKIILTFIIFFLFQSNVSTATDSLKIKELELRIQKLQIENDTLKYKFSNIEKSDYKSLDVIETVNDFYDKSWNKLMAFLAISSSIILFLIPYLQSKKQKAEFDLNKREFQDYTTQKLDDLETKIISFSNDQFEKLKEEISSLNLNINKNLNEEVDYVHAMSYFLKAQIGELKENKYEMLKNYLIAAEKLIELNREEEVSAVLKTIKSKVENLKTDNFKVSKENKKLIKAFIKLLEQKYSEIYKDLILEFEKLYDAE